MSLVYHFFGTWCFLVYIIMRYCGHTVAFICISTGIFCCDFAGRVMKTDCDTVLSLDLD